MTRRSKGPLAGKTRNLTRHNKPSTLGVNDIIKSLKVGDKVAIVPKSNGRDIPHPRYKGRIGNIIEVRGASYIVEIKIMNAKRKIVVPAMHLDKR